MAIERDDRQAPDFILAEYMMGCLSAFTRAQKEKDRWYGKKVCIGGIERV